MPIEIERKYLVCSDAWRSAATRHEPLRQGYLSKRPEGSVRVRLGPCHATLTVKSRRDGCVRHEFEYPIPLAHAEDMLRLLCGARVIEKVRHQVPFGGMLWEVDEYGGAAAGLVMAEIELKAPDQPFVLPDWVGREVTHNKRYRNDAIARAAARAVGGAAQRKGKSGGALPESAAGGDGALTLKCLGRGGGAWTPFQAVRRGA
ncbi:MAG: CYTH domain-containing protein [Phenylobacterium sp.]